MRRWILLFGAALAACGDDSGSSQHPDGPRPDAMVGGIDGGMPDGSAPPDAGPPDGPPTPSERIAFARAAADGPTNLMIEGAIVTATIPAVGVDPAGFFIQAEQAGPALFVAIDPATLDPAAAAGQEVSFTITTIATAVEQKRASAITDWTVTSSGHDTAALEQDVSAASDLVSAIGHYESELIHLEGTLVGAFAAAGAGHVSARIATSGVPSDNNLVLRIPTSHPAAQLLTPGCSFVLDGTPLWRFGGLTQPSAWTAGELTVDACPRPRVVAATAASTTSIVVTFDRDLSAASVAADGSQFSFDNGLSAVAAAATGSRAVTVTTSAQSAIAYAVTVAASLTDTLGGGIDPAANSTSFNGFVPRARLLISEINANISGNCDLLELVVVAGGSMESFFLKERDVEILRFGAFNVATGDVVVVHVGRDSGTCNPGGATQETASKTEQATTGNYATAWDWWSSDAGLTNTDNVFALFDNLGVIVDAVLVADAATGTAAAGSETGAAIVAGANEWHMVGGGLPAGGFVDDAFREHAVLDLNATGTNAGGTTIQRIDATDDNDESDWTSGPGNTQTWGVANP